MICPICKAQSKQSRVYELGGTVTAVYCPPFYDEMGHRHDHDSNIARYAYECSNGHSWSEKGAPNTCWCGWMQGSQM